MESHRTIDNSRRPSVQPFPRVPTNTALYLRAVRCIVLCDTITLHSPRTVPTPDAACATGYKLSGALPCTTP